MEVKVILIAVTLLLLQFFSGAYMNFVVPVLAAMAAYFEADAVSVSLVATIPALCMIPSNLISGKLAKTVSNKLLMFIGIILFLIGGIGPAFANSITVVLVLRGVLGFGVGMIMPLALGLIPVYFQGKAQLTMMGLANALGGLFATAASLVGGFLGRISWQAPFYAFSFAALILLMIVFFLPEPLKVAGQANSEASQQTQAAEKTPLPLAIYVYCGTLLIMFMTMLIMHNTLSSFVVAEGMGDTAQAGLVLSVSSFAMFIIAVFFSQIYDILKDWAIPVSIACSALAFFLLSSADSFLVVMVAAALIGVTMGLINPTIFAKTAMAAPNNVAFATSIVMVGLMLGQFLSSYLLKFFIGLFGADAFRSIYLWDGVLVTVVAVVAIAGTVYTKGKNPKIGVGA
jgi:MFS family permease